MTNIRQQISSIKNMIETTSSKTTQERPKNLTNMILVARQCDNKSDDAT